jgi:prepilin-type N-terminal cleavage/methylation domain-containing protein
MDQLEKGLTLVEMLVVLAILAILAAGGYRLIGMIPETQSATSAVVFKEAVRQLSIQALTDEGAEMTWNGKGGIQITSLGASPYTKGYQVASKERISLDGQPFQCLVLDPRGFPNDPAISSCSDTNPTQFPLQWSITDGASTISFQ